MTTYVFDRITARGWKRVKCAICGKALERSRTFGMTLNQFNKNPDGTVRDERDIRLALSKQIEAWQGEPETHAKCGGAS